MLEKIRRFKVGGKLYQLSHKPMPGWPAWIKRSNAYTVHRVNEDNNALVWGHYFDTLEDAEKWIAHELPHI